MEGFEKNNEFREGVDRKFRKEIYSKAVRAGKRTYFFDVKSTRSDDFFLTITESKKHYDQDGKYYFEKHKIFLYKEDFEKFADGLEEVVEFIRERQPGALNQREAQPAYDEQPAEQLSAEEPEYGEEEQELVNNYTNVEFEDI
ncbi:DUF3276 family protein [Mangrovibacterium marinum]|uniref:Uncharacterized protein DUF3276 n=1 Tax=Mangrovibacterium marinum TaxID=1639118 RepID=A0A2T5C0V4_9BACT|nr:DUF3276 family protein [Mangrovibacterium marinum]PTN08237.1 uncharacterized protein DUF3276 [Mangrovibacterium marinum]